MTTHFAPSSSSLRYHVGRTKVDCCQRRPGTSSTRGAAAHRTRALTRMSTMSGTRVRGLPEFWVHGFEILKLEVTEYGNGAALQAQEWRHILPRRSSAMADGHRRRAMEKDGRRLHSSVVFVVSDQARKPNTKKVERPVFSRPAVGALPLAVRAHASHCLLTGRLRFPRLQCHFVP